MIAHNSLFETSVSAPVTLRVRREPPKVDVSGDWMLGGFFLALVALLALIPLLF